MIVQCAACKLNAADSVGKPFHMTNLRARAPVGQHPKKPLLRSVGTGRNRKTERGWHGLALVETPRAEKWLSASYAPAG
jgi:hypothetical protein